MSPIDLDDDMEAEPVGSKLRFRVSDPELGSGSSWSVEIAKATSDVYVFHREGARWVKASLHESGQWHFGATRKARDLVDGAPGYFGVTHQRDEIAPGWHRAMLIVVPHSELRIGYSESVSKKDVVDIPIDPTSDATCVILLLGEPGASRVQVADAFHVATMLRADGGQVVVYATPVSLVEPIHSTLSDAIAAARSDLLGLGWDGTTAARIVISGVNSLGHMQQVEVAIDPPAVAPVASGSEQ